jgi:hypothetical protein
MNGLWTAEFGTSSGMFGGGVAVFRDGKIMGGDGTYYYIGEYNLIGKALKARMKISPFIEGAESVFKTRHRVLTLELEGSLINESLATAQGRALEMPHLNFAVKLTKQAEV